MRTILVSLFLGLVGLTAINSWAATAPQPVIRVSAAASLTSAFAELVTHYQQQHPQHQIQVNLASSGALAKQIAAGAPADLYIAANPQWMDYLEQQNQIAGATIVTLLHNRLVCVGPPPAKISRLDELAQLHRIALCSPASSPAGHYAQQALESIALYRPLLDQSKLVMAKDVRQALRYAERQLVDAAIVYASDAIASDAVTTWFFVPEHLYPPVNYPMALTHDGHRNPAARQLYDYLQSPQAHNVLTRYGFRLTP